MRTIYDMDDIQCRHPETHAQCSQIADPNVPWQDVKDTEETDDAWRQQFWVIDVHSGCRERVEVGVADFCEDKL